MRCSRPNYVLDLGVKENGSRNLKFLPKRVDLYSWKQLSERYGSANVIPLPCGKCLNCRLNKANEWSVRCMLESLEHENNWFVTLTYDDEHLPEDGLLHRDVLQKFFKRLRKYTKFRYFGCGEYGTKNGRPHYHVILFGADIDFKPIGLGLGESKIISDCWPFGFNYIGDVSYSSCNYVARYTTKKLFGEVDKPGEFLCMSNKPGIGANYCKEHLSTILEYDKVFGNFGSSKQSMLPRYFDKIAEKLDSDRYAEMKKVRLDKGNEMLLHQMLQIGLAEQEEFLKYKQEISIRDFVSKKRGMRL